MLFVRQLFSFSLPSFQSHLLAIGLNETTRALEHGQLEAVLAMKASFLFLTRLTFCSSLSSSPSSPRFGCLLLFRSYISVQDATPTTLVSHLPSACAILRCPLLPLSAEEAMDIAVALGLKSLVCLGLKVSAKTEVRFLW